MDCDCGCLSISIDASMRLIIDSETAEPFPRKFSISLLLGLAGDPVKFGSDRIKISSKICHQKGESV